VHAREGTAEPSDALGGETTVSFSILAQDPPAFRTTLEVTLEGGPDVVSTHAPDLALGTTFLVGATDHGVDADGAVSVLPEPWLAAIFPLQQAPPDLRDETISALRARHCDPGGAPGPTAPAVQVIEDSLGAACRH
jgi:hypothetical protein